MSKLFKDYLSERMPMSLADWQFIESRFESIELPVGQLLLEEGEVCRHLYFLEKGLLRYFVWQDGVDATKYFTYDSILFTAVQSFQRQERSKENIETLEDCRLLRCSYQQLQEIRKAVPNWYLLTARVMSDVQGWTEEIMMALQHETAFERYEQLLEKQGDLLARIPLRHLASFLGIAPESLSRIRKKISLKWS